MSENFKYIAFISYASEQSSFVSELAGGLKARGLSIWYDEFELRVGEKLLDSINKGLGSSKYGVLIISEDYLQKGWTKYELDILSRQYIEKNKKLFPIWYGISKEKIEDYCPSLTGIVGLKSEIGIMSIVQKLTAAMSEGMPTVAQIPGWEFPTYRFLRGDGELKVANDGPAFTIWEAVLHIPDSSYPIGVYSEIFTKEDLIINIAQNLEGNKRIAERFVGEDGIEKLRDLCIKYGLNPKDFAW